MNSELDTLLRLRLGEFEVTCEYLNQFTDELLVQIRNNIRMNQGHNALPEDVILHREEHINSICGWSFSDNFKEIFRIIEATIREYYVREYS
jgi:hypothetical protein